MKQNTPVLDCWLTVGSTYTYLAVVRIPEFEKRFGVQFRFRPFNLRLIFNEMGYFPFPPNSPKTAYMWRDLERRAGMYGIPIRLPVPYPAKDVLLANRVALIGSQEGWASQFIRASYRQWFEHGREPGSEANLSESLREAGQQPARVLEAANGEDAHNLYGRETSIARDLGVFGSPTFAVGQELFWGDDRLEDAVSWAKNGRVLRQP